MNRIHKAKHRNTKRSAIVLALLLLAGCVLFPDMEARADSLSVRASASTVKIGDTVTISITVPAGVSATVNLTYPGSLFSFQSASETANANGGTVSMTLGGYGGTDTATTGTVTFKATSAGSATFSASAPVAGNQEGDQVSIGGGSASVTVRNEASGGSSSSGGGDSGGSSSGGSGGGDSGGSSSGGSGGGDSGGSSSGDPKREDDGGEGSKSADNSLSSLTLSAGKLSPAFRYNVVNYTATVDYNVTSVVVSARVSNANAKIESVKGGENLSVGDNKIRIVVKAENGVTATYTVTVTRKAKEEEEEEKEEEEEENAPQDGDDEEEPPLEPNDDDPPESTEKSFVVDGRTLYPSQDIPEGIEAQGFELENVMLWGQTFPAFVDSFAGGTMQLVYLVDENGENGGLYLVFSDNMNEAYSYVCLRAERGFLIILPDGDGNVPKEYEAMPTALDLEGFGRVDAWFRDSEREFALVYAVNQLGERGWYTLDTQSLSYVRYQEPAVPAVEEEPSTEQQKEELPSDGADNKKQQTTSHLMIGVAVIVVLIILIIIILVVVLKRSGNMDDDEFDEPDDDDFRSDADAEEEPEKDFDRGIKEPEKDFDCGIKEPEKDFDRGIKEPDFSAVEAGLAAAMEKEMADEIKKIADPAPMQAVSTHKDKDDEDLEFIDF